MIDTLNKDYHLEIGNIRNTKGSFLFFDSAITLGRQGLNFYLKQNKFEKITTERQRYNFYIKRKQFDFVRDLIEEKYPIHNF